jgi:hypothetical protein
MFFARHMSRIVFFIGGHIVTTLTVVFIRCIDMIYIIDMFRGRKVEFIIPFIIGGIVTCLTRI